MHVLAIIQARVGSTRLPGKVMYPLNGRPALKHVVNRTNFADSVSDIVVATSVKSQDDVINHYAPRFGADVVRGSEANVLSRFKSTIEEYNTDLVIRITGDCPLISPRFIDASIDRLMTKRFDYVSAGFDRTFPRGVTCESFTAESFERVVENSNEPRHREHVTPYYREHPDEFEMYNLESNELFEGESVQNRSDIRLTLDEPADYQLLETVYREVEYEGILDVRDAIRYVDEEGLAGINQDVEQKPV